MLWNANGFCNIPSDKNDMNGHINGFNINARLPVMTTVAAISVTSTIVPMTAKAAQSLGLLMVHMVIPWDSFQTPRIARSPDANKPAITSTSKPLH